MPLDELLKTRGPAHEFMHGWGPAAHPQFRVGGPVRGEVATRGVISIKDFCRGYTCLLLAFG